MVICIKSLDISIGLACIAPQPLRGGAQSFPDKSITIMVGSTAGSPTAGLARSVGRPAVHYIPKKLAEEDCCK